MKDKKPKKLTKRQSGEWHMPVMDGYLMGCCDCGLVHKVDFRIIDEKTQKKVKGFRFIMRAFRLERETSRQRKLEGITILHKKYKP